MAKEDLQLGQSQRDSSLCTLRACATMLELVPNCRSHTGQLNALTLSCTVWVWILRFDAALNVCWQRLHLCSRRFSWTALTCLRMLPSSLNSRWQ